MKKEELQPMREYKWDEDFYKEIIKDHLINKHVSIFDLGPLYLAIFFILLKVHHELRSVSFDVINFYGF